MAHKNTLIILRFTYLMLASILFAIPLAMADEDTFDIGMSTALSGPAKSLGISVSAGVEVLFSEVNLQGGLHDRRLRLIVRDDGYHPPDAARQMEILISRDKVLAVIGNLGTPTAEVTVPIAEQHKTLLFGAVTGAGLLRPTPPFRYVINFRASYEEEMVKLVDLILGFGINPDEISFFIQNDSYGEAGYQSALKAIRKKGFKNADQLPLSSYPRNTIEVEDALLQLMDAAKEPRAIIIVGTAAPTAKFIKVARELFPGVRFFCISFVGAQALTNALSKDISDVYISEVVPSLDSGYPIVQSYLKALADHAPDASPSSLSLEGYISAHILVEAIRRAGPDVNRESLIDAMEGLNEIDIGLGAPLYLSDLEHQASHNVWLSVIEQGKLYNTSKSYTEK